METKSKRISISKNDMAFYILTYLFLFIIFILVLYPLVYVLSSSFSSPAAVLSGKVILWPVNPSLDGYTTIFKNGDILIGYYNSFRYMIIGTIINVCMSMVCAYPLARRETPYKGVLMFLFTFTMFFGGGLIPNYIVIMKLGLIDTIGAMVLPGAISVYNMILCRTFIQNSIPHELLEASKIDGCNDARYFFQIVLPLSKAIIAVITLYYAVGHWNAFFNAFLYLNKRYMYPLQLFLREILITNTIDPASDVDPELLVRKQGLGDLLKYSLIVVATAPMMMMYPLAQKYFIQGVMIGSLKG